MWNIIVFVSAPVSVSTLNIYDSISGADPGFSCNQLLTLYGGANIHFFYQISKKPHKIQKILIREEAWHPGPINPPVMSCTLLSLTIQYDTDVLNVISFDTGVINVTKIYNIGIVTDTSVIVND